MNQLITREADHKGGGRTVTRMTVATEGSFNAKGVEIKVNFYSDQSDTAQVITRLPMVADITTYATAEQCDAIAELFAEAAKLLRAGQQKAA